MNLLIRSFILFLLYFNTFSILAQDTQEVHVVMETARPEHQINKQFPYDIELLDANGNSFNSSGVLKNKSKATVLLFWMTTCGPCRKELNAISKVYNNWKQQIDFDFYAISTDFSFRKTQFENRVKESNWPFPAYLDINREFQYVMQGGLNGLPQLFVLDKNGKIIYHAKRYIQGDENLLFEALKKLSRS